MVPMVLESLEIMSRRAEEIGSCVGAAWCCCILAWPSENGDSCCVEEGVPRRSSSSESEVQGTPPLLTLCMLEDMES